MKTLHDYQAVGRAFLRGRDRAGLFLDMGLGKTIICLSALEPRHLPVVIIAPKKVAESVWHAERDDPDWGDLIMPHLKLVRVIGSPAERAAALASNADVYVISRDNQGDLLTNTDRPKFSTLIVDELSGYKSPASARYKTVRKLIAKDRITHVWGLTGTPSPNGMEDLWAQIAVLDGGARLGKNITAYRSRYFFPGRQIANGTVVEWILREEAEVNIRTKIEDLCLSMSTDGRVELPDVTYNIVPVQLPTRARAAYRDLKNQLLADMRDLIGGEIHTAANAAILGSKLSQLTAGFLFVDDADIRHSAYTKVHSAKIDAIRDLLEVATSPVLLFYRFRPELLRLRASFPQGRMVGETGIIDEWNAGKVPLMFAHPASASHGLNLQKGGHTAIWSTLPWSLEEWEQANKRLHRQGQKHPVVIHLVMADKSVDHVILNRLNGKAVVQTALMDHLESPI